MPFVLGAARAQNEPILVPDAVDYQKLLPILPEPPRIGLPISRRFDAEDVGGFSGSQTCTATTQGEGGKGAERCD